MAKLSPLPFTSLLFSAICKTSLDNHFAFLHFFFLGMVLITASCTMLWSSVHSSSGLLSIRSNHLCLLTVSSFSVLSYKEYTHSDFCIDHLVMSICRVISCIVGRGCLLAPVHCLGKTLLAFALFDFVLQGQTCLLLQVSLDFLLLHSSPLL